MRYLVKGDCGLPCTDPSTVQRAVRRRTRRGSVRRVIALLCIVLASIFIIQLFRNAGVSSPVSPEWESPSSIIFWLRWNLNSVGCQIRNEVKGAVPFGNLAVILKLACCAVAAAVFLRGPSRS